MHCIIKIGGESEKMELLCFNYLDFIAPNFPPLCVFDSSLCIFNVVIQDKSHSFHSVKYNLRQTEKNRISRCQKGNNGQL